MTLEALISDLQSKEPDLPLIFHTDAGDIGAGYHVTELKHLTVNSIDCGGRRAGWDEVVLQLLDGAWGEHMKVGKFISIARRSIDAVDGLGHASLSIEYAPGNAGLHRYRIGHVSADRDGLRVSLLPDAAECKPRKALDCCARPQKKADQTARPVTDCCA